MNAAHGENPYHERLGLACRLTTVKVALSVRNAHAAQMAKTWISKTSVKSARAFARAMRPLLNPKGNRNQGNRPR
jgi:hypothetical protein